MKELTPHKQCQLIVEKFVKTPINWAREIKIAQKLLKENEYHVFDSLTLPYKIAGLNFFLCQDGIERLEKEKNKKELVFPEREKIELSETKIGADYNINPPQQSLLDFLS